MQRCQEQQTDEMLMSFATNLLAPRRWSANKTIETFSRKLEAAVLRMARLGAIEEETRLEIMSEAQLSECPDEQNEFLRVTTGENGHNDDEMHEFLSLAEGMSYKEPLSEAELSECEMQSLATGVEHA